MRSVSTFVYVSTVDAITGEPSKASAVERPLSVSTVCVSVAIIQLVYALVNIRAGEAISAETLITVACIISNCIIAACL